MTARSKEWRRYQRLCQFEQAENAQIAHRAINGICQKWQTEIRFLAEKNTEPVFGKYIDGYYVARRVYTNDELEFDRQAYADPTIIDDASTRRGHDDEWRQRRIWLELPATWAFWANAPQFAEWRLRYAFGVMLELADRIGAEINDPPAIRAWRAALAVSHAYHNDQRVRKITRRWIVAATIVNEAAAWVLRTKSLSTVPDNDRRWQQRAADWATTAFIVAGESSRDVATAYARNHKSLPERRDRDYLLVEKRFEQFCRNYKSLLIPPQNDVQRVHGVYSDFPSYWRTVEPKTKHQATLPRNRVAEAELELLAWAQIGFRKTAEAMGFGAAVKKLPAGLAAEYPTPSHPPLPRETESKASTSPPRINYRDPVYVEIDGKSVAVVHFHPQKAWHLEPKPWRLGSETGGAPRDEPNRHRDLVSRINETLTPAKYRIFES